MWLKRFTHYLLKHPLVAMLFTFVIPFTPFFGVISILFAGMITLLQGPLRGAIYTLLASLPYGLMYMATEHTHKMSPFAISFAILSNVLTWMLASVWRRPGANLSIILQVSALLGVLMVSVIHLINPEIANWWSQLLSSQVHHLSALTGSLNTASGTLHPEITLDKINLLKDAATGYFTAAILLIAVFQVIISKWWLSLVFNPGTLQAELHYLRLMPLAGLLFLMAMVFSYWGNALIFDILPILYLLFLGFGLSLIHYLFRLIRPPTRLFCLMVFYTAMIYTAQISILVISLFAFLDIWWNVRQRVKST